MLHEASSNLVLLWSSRCSWLAESAVCITGHVAIRHQLFVLHHLHIWFLQIRTWKFHTFLYRDNLSEFTFPSALDCMGVNICFHFGIATGEPTGIKLNMTWYSEFLGANILMVQLRTWNERHFPSGTRPHVVNYKHLNILAITDH